MSLEALVPLVLLGALLGLDVVSFPQAMISRPIVAATLAGVVVGQPDMGVLCGVALELIALETLPVGASRYPEWGSAAVVGGALFASQPAGRAGALVLSLVAALASASVSGGSMVVLRRLNAKRAQAARAAIDAGSWPAVRNQLLVGVLLDLLRGGLVTAGALLIFRPLMQAVLGSWTIPSMYSRSVVVTMLASVAVAAAWKLFHGSHQARWYFAGGLAAGLALLAVVR